MIGLTNFFEVSKYALVTLVFIGLIIAVLASPILISGHSMMPNFQDREVVVIDKISYREQPIMRGDVVAVKFPADPKKTLLIKRVVGLPGETIVAKNGQIFVNSQPLTEPYLTVAGATVLGEIPPITLKSDEYFLSGDNRPNSSDSRVWGPIVRSDVIGRAVLIVFPFKETRIIERINYQLAAT